jgi:hypothetical protein
LSFIEDPSPAATLLTAKIRDLLNLPRGRPAADRLSEIVLEIESLSVLDLETMPARSFTEAIESGIVKYRNNIKITQRLDSKMLMKD